MPVDVIGLQILYWLYFIEFYLPGAYQKTKETRTRTNKQAHTHTHTNRHTHGPTNARTHIRIYNHICCCCRIVTCGYYSEKDAAQCVREMLEAVKVRPDVSRHKVVIRRWPLSPITYHVVIKVSVITYGLHPYNRRQLVLFTQSIGVWPNRRRLY